MKIYKYPDKKLWNVLATRPFTDADALEKTVRKIMLKVKKNGDKAVLKYTRKFDGIKGYNLLVTQEEIQQAEPLLSESLKNSMLLAKNNIEIFHASQKKESPKIETMPGVVCWQQSLPIEKVGLYIPGGTAPLLSTVLMLGIPAQLAGCREVIICTPAGKNGNVHPAILYAAQLCGISTIIKAGGVQAIAGMTYGTETIPKVFKIFGPGNQYVMSAKQKAQGEGVAIDMPAGPSEVLVIADDTAIPSFVAADLLAQAEHGIDSQVLLVTTSEEFGKKVLAEIDQQLKGLPRKKIATAALKNSTLIVMKELNEAVAFSNFYAPEHLILACADPENATSRVTSAGSVFLGNYSPESAGDYATGTNHTLPTNGFAAMYSGVSLDSFVKKISFQQLTKEGLAMIGPAVMEMAATEGLTAHKNAITIRLKN